MSRKNNGSMKQIGSSHRGRRGKIKDNPNPETSDGEKTSILSMNISDIGKALRASSSKTSKKADLPAEWNVRANLLPRSIVTLNRDRAIKYLLSYVLIVVVVAAIAISAGMAVRVSWADHRVEEAQAKTLSLQKEKAEFKDVEDTLNSLSDSQRSRIAALYDEMDWMKVVDSLNGALPAGGQYTNLSLSSFQIGGSDASSHSATSSVWSGNGVISVDFTVLSPDFISAKDFIGNFAAIPTYKTGYVSSITENSDENGTTYTYTGTVSLKMDTNTTSRSDNAAGADEANRALQQQLRDSLNKAAAGESTDTTDSATATDETSNELSGAIMNKHKIAWIALAAGIVFVIMLTWLVGVSPQISHIKSSDAQTAQIDENNKETRDEIETLRIASETIGLQKDRLRQLQRQIPDGYNQQEFINSLDASAAGTGVAIKSVNFDDAVDADIPAEMQGTIQAGQLVQVSVSITATGSYDAMRNFVASVQNINRIAVPENVTYTLDRNGDETKNAVVIDCKIWSLLLDNDTVEDENATKQ